MLGAGHNGVLIGNDSTGYEFRSFRPSNVVGGYYVPEYGVIGSSATDNRRFDTLQEALTYANSQGYKRYIRYTTCEGSDKKALAAADNWQQYYYLFGHQSDNFATTVLNAGGINMVPLNTPNFTFQFLRTNGGWLNFGYGGQFGFTQSPK